MSLVLVTGVVVISKTEFKTDRFYVYTVIVSFLFDAVMKN